MENKQKNPRRRLNSLILLVAFTAIMLIVSTYAWFSAQKNVTIGGLEGKVNVAEGLMVSLDAKNWTQAIDLGTGVTGFLDAGKTLTSPYDGRTNSTPSEMIPVSTTATQGATSGSTTDDSGIGLTDVRFYKGVNVNSTELHTVTEASLTETVATEDDFAGVYAIDLFLQNSSKIYDDKDGDGVKNEAGDEQQGVTKETLQLNTNSVFKLVTGGTATTGLQNTARIGLAVFEDNGNGSVAVTATQEQVLTAYSGSTIRDVAIWEPNSDNHVDYVVRNNNSITWNPAVKSLYLLGYTDDKGTTETNDDVEVLATARTNKFMSFDQLPTYALTADSLNLATTGETLTAKNADGTAYKGIKDIYDWDDSEGEPAGTPAPTVERQIALQTKTEDDYSTYDGGVRNLVSVTSSGEAVYILGNETGYVPFQIYKNEIAKVRLYVWLEGQDVDTINYASHGGGVHLDLGLVKSAIPGQQAS